ncbi:MAG: ABC transporter permease [Pseudomonadota bacterium]
MAIETTDIPEAEPSPRLRLSFELWLGLGLLAVIILGSALSPWIAPYDPQEIDFTRKLLPPSFAHPFGTDSLGRDVFSRVLAAGQTSVLIGFATVLAAVIIGLPIGLMAGYFGGRLDSILMRTSEIFLAFPPLLLPILIVAVLGPGLLNAMIAVAISWFPWYARIMRGATIAIREELYVKAARAMGVSDVAILFRHILPNASSPLLAQGSLDFGYAILAAAALGFLGLGARPPSLEWGMMIAENRSLIFDYWWTAVFPGLAIAIGVIAANLIGDGARDALDPHNLTER